MAKFAINASGAMLLPSLVQVSEPISGSVVPLAMFSIPVPIPSKKMKNSQEQEFPGPGCKNRRKASPVQPVQLHFKSAKKLKVAYHHDPL